MKSPPERLAAALEQRIPSRLDAAESLCLKIRGLLEATDPGEVGFAVELLARECLTNAVVHGNRNHADKSIRLRLWLGRKWICLEVSDEGPGFTGRGRVDPASRRDRHRAGRRASSRRGQWFADDALLP